MGFLSSIGKVAGSALGGLVGGPSGAAIGGSLGGEFGGFLGDNAGSMISGGLSYLGQSSANAASLASTREQMDFQKEMRATQYQTAVEDLKKAGLNPMLAYKNGGAGNLSGATYTAQNAVGEGISSANESKMANSAFMKQKAEIKNLEEQNKFIPAQTQEAIDRARFMRQQSATEVAREFRETQAAKIDRERMDLDRVVGLAQAENYLAAKRNYDSNSALSLANIGKVDSEKAANYTRGAPYVIGRDIIGQIPRKGKEFIEWNWPQLKRKK